MSSGQRSTELAVVVDVAVCLSEESGTCAGEIVWPDTNMHHFANTKARAEHVTCARRSHAAVAVDG